MNNNLTKITHPCLNVVLGNVPAYVFMISVKDLLFIKYIAVRGRSNEQGAVQRLLSPIRLKSIEEYVLKGNTFYSPFYLNWSNANANISISNSQITIPLVAESAQVLDGQHRLAGMERAVAKKPELENQKVLVILSNRLDTKQAAEVFLNINTEQKPVPKSLIYDLFGLINADDPDLPLVRAKDLAMALQKDNSSPYFNSIKMPGSMRGVGVIDMSTIVNSLKLMLEEDGGFVKYKILTLENQISVILNYFNAIKKIYSMENQWYSKTNNPFLTNAGFVAASEVLNKTLMVKCAAKKEFSQEVMIELLHLDTTPLLLRSDIKNMDGKTQRKVIVKYLEDAINNDIPDEDAYKF